MRSWSFTEALENIPTIIWNRRLKSEAKGWDGVEEYPLVYSIDSIWTPPVWVSLEAHAWSQFSPFPPVSCTQWRVAWRWKRFDGWVAPKRRLFGLLYYWQTTTCFKSFTCNLWSLYIKHPGPWRKVISPTSANLPHIVITKSASTRICIKLNYKILLYLLSLLTYNINLLIKK